MGKEIREKDDIGFPFMPNAVCLPVKTNICSFMGLSANTLCLDTPLPFLIFLFSGPSPSEYSHPPPLT